MEFTELIQTRYSVRAYRSDPIEPAKLDRVLEAARLAPTAAGRQPFRILVIPTAGRTAELGRIYPRPWFVQAPLLIAACTMASESWVRRDGKIYADVDIAIAMDHLILAAANEGLGTCWVAAFDPAAAREVLRLEPGLEPVVFTPLGYAADSPRPKQRKALGELIRKL
ncbi:MAG: nitroreductase family protein [Acidobacteriota bacterium]|nr:nitroreductase family protein [Acidobacteriota bacterium]